MHFYEISNNHITLNDNEDLFHYRSDFTTFIQTFIDVDYDLYTTTIEEHQPLIDLIPLKSYLDVPTRKLFINNQAEIDNIEEKNKLIAIENQSIIEQNKRIELQNKQIKDNAKTTSFLDVSEESELIHYLGQLLNKSNIGQSYCRLKFNEAAYIYIDELIQLINSPVIIKNDGKKYVCRLYEILDYEKIVDNNELYDHCLNYLFHSLYKQSQYVIYTPNDRLRFKTEFKIDDTIDYESLCKLPAIDINGLQNLFSPFIINRQLEENAKVMKLYQSYQDNMNDFISPLLETTNDINQKINKKLEQYNQEMIEHANTFHNIVKEMK